MMFVLQPFTNIITFAAAAEIVNIIFFPIIVFVNFTLDIIVKLCD